MATKMTKKTSESPLETLSIAEWIYHILFHNIWLKILSLGFAIVLFLLLRSEQEKDFFKVVSLRIVTASNMLVIGPKIRTAEATIRVPTALFSQPPSDTELVGTIDLSHERPGRIRVKLSRENFSTLDRQHNIFFKNPWLDVDLDYEVSRTVDVKANLQGSPAPGFVVESVFVKPSKMKISGAKNELARVDSVSTSPVFIDNLSSSFSILSKLYVPEHSSVKPEEELVSIQILINKSDNP